MALIKCTKFKKMNNNRKKQSMKKAYLILLFGIMTLGICGCSNSKAEYESKKINCSILNDIKFVYTDYIKNTYVITNKGKLYMFGSYSDDTNCKILDNDITFTKILNSFFVDNQGNLFNVEDDKIKKYEFEANIDFLINDSNIIKTSTDGNGNYYILKDDGIIYVGDFKTEYSNNRQEHTTTHYIDNEKVYKSFENEKVLDFSNENQDNIIWIKTDKAYYIRKVKDEKCYQYDDVKCEYEYQKDEELTEQYNNISYLKNCSQKNKCDYILKDGTLMIFRKLKNSI